MSSRPSLLLVDDDVLIQLMVEDIGGQLGCDFTPADTGAAAREALERTAFDLVILDRRLPDIDGLLLAPTLKEELRLPFIVLSGMTSPTDQVLGLGLGASDYICKPVEPTLLGARIKARLAHVAAADELADIQIGRNMTLDRRSRRLKIAGRIEALSPAETLLLACLAKNAGAPCDRMQISKAICGREWVYGDRTVDVLVSRVRRRVTGGDALIVTVHGLGYMLVEKEDE